MTADLCPRSEYSAEIDSAVNRVLPDEKIGLGLKAAKDILSRRENILPCISSALGAPFHILKSFDRLLTGDKKCCLLYDVLRHALKPTTHLSMRELYRFAGTRGYDSLLPADRSKLVELLLEMLDDGSLKRAFAKERLSRHIAYRKVRMQHFPTLASLGEETCTSDVLSRENYASDVLSHAIETVWWQVASDKYHSLQPRRLLTVIEEASRLFAADDKQVLSSNYMSVEKNTETTRALCEKNKDATKLFGQEALIDSEQLLVIRCTTYDPFENFWVPLMGSNHFYLGACYAYYSKKPRVVFCEHVDSRYDFGESVPGQFKEGMARYFRGQEQIYRAFVSFPVLDMDNKVVGVTNVNFSGDELLLYDVRHVELMWLRLRPLLAALAVCSKTYTNTGDNNA